MTFNEVDNLVLVEAVNVVPVAVVLLPALNPVAEPTTRNPLLNLVVVFAQALLKVAHGVSLADPAGKAQGLDLHYYGRLSALQALGDGRCGDFPKQSLQAVKLFLCPGTTILRDAQAETPRLAFDVPAGEAGLPRQFSDDTAR